MASGIAGSQRNSPVAPFRPASTGRWDLGRSSQSVPGCPLRATVPHDPTDRLRLIFPGPSCLRQGRPLLGQSANNPQPLRLCRHPLQQVQHHAVQERMVRTLIGCLPARDWRGSATALAVLRWRRRPVCRGEGPRPFNQMHGCWIPVVEAPLPAIGAARAAASRDASCHRSW